MQGRLQCDFKLAAFATRQQGANRQVSTDRLPLHFLRRCSTPLPAGGTCGLRLTHTGMSLSPAKDLQGL